MVGTISPVVYGRRRMGTWYRLMVIYALSQVAGAGLTGLVFAALGIALRAFCPAQWTILAESLAFVAVIGALRDLKLVRVWLPSHFWQVPQSWKRFPAPIMAACYGFGIGLGVLTRIPFASLYFVLLACTGLASVPVGVGLMVLYGAARAGTVALVARGQASAPTPRERLTTIGLLTPLIGYLDGLALALVAGLLLCQSLLAHL